VGYCGDRFLHRARPDGSAPSLGLNDSATGGAVEKKIGAEVPAASDSGDAVARADEERLEEHLELRAGHRVDVPGAGLDRAVAHGGPPGPRHGGQSDDEQQEPQARERATSGAIEHGSEQKERYAARSHRTGGVPCELGGQAAPFGVSRRRRIV
jgi:hypothetical protein